MEIQEIDQIKETFTAIFVLKFCYVDPTFSYNDQRFEDHFLKVKYIDPDAEERVKEVRAQITGIEEGLGRICMIAKGGAQLRIFRRDLLAVVIDENLKWDEHMKVDTWFGIIGS